MSKEDFIKSMHEGAQKIIDQINVFAGKYLKREPPKMVTILVERLHQAKTFIKDILEHVPEKICDRFGLYKEDTLPRLVDIQTDAEVDIVTIAYRARIVYNVPELKPLRFVSNDGRFSPTSEITVALATNKTKIAANQLWTLYHDQVATSIKDQYDTLLRVTINSVERANILSRSERNLRVQALRDLETIEKRLAAWKEGVHSAFERCNEVKGPMSPSDYVRAVQKFYAGADVNLERFTSQTFQGIEDVSNK